MRIKLDENIPLAFAATLRERGHDTDTVYDEGLASKPDGAILSATLSEKRFLVTQDLDFSDLRKLKAAEHQGVLLVRLEQPGRKALLEYLTALAAQYDWTTWRGCIVVASHHRVRVRKLIGTLFRP